MLVFVEHLPDFVSSLLFCDVQLEQCNWPKDNMNVTSSKSTCQLHIYIYIFYFFSHFETINKN